MIIEILEKYLPSNYGMSGNMKPFNASH